MRIHFGPEFDRHPWGGPPDEAAFDEMACGPLQLVAELEGQLGIPAVRTPAYVRAAALLPQLTTMQGAYWLQSAESDALGTAVRLVRDYDALTLAGWQIGTGTPRLQQLASLCAQVPVGLAGRLQRVVALLGVRASRVKQILLYAPRKSFAGLWQTALAKLAQTGVEILEAAALQSQARGDLGAASKQSGTFTGDASLQCLVSWGPIEAAEHVAAWIAADKVAGTLVVTPDAVLDAALARHGLPTLGLAASASSGLVQLVPLCLALGWSPIDPQHAVEMLGTTPNPLSNDLRRRLMQALATWPAVGSLAWCAATEAATVEDRHALEALFTPQFDRLDQKYAAEAMLARCAFLKTWFATLAPPPHDAIALCDAIEATLAVAQISSMSEGQMQRLLSLVISEVGGAAAHPPQAGLSRVDTPAAVVQPARRVIWWNFHDANARVPGPLPLTFAEGETLAQAGLVLPTPGEVAAQTAAGWRRPLMAATESLLLVSPRHCADGEAAHPHPLWDEILAPVPRRLRAAALARLVVKVPRAAVPAKVRRRTLRPLPKPAARLQVLRRTLKREGPESPGSLETLLGCSFKWAMHYLANLDAGALPIVTPNNMHIGSFAHLVLQDLVLQPNRDGEQAATWAMQQFDTQGPLHLAPLFLPGASAERSAVRSHLERAVRIFFQLRKTHGWHVAATELELSKPLGELTLRGFLDVQLDEPLAVVDFKWGSSTRHSDKLRHNTASQLASYSYLSAKEDGVLPPVAYFILKTARLWTPDQGGLKGGVQVGGDVNVMWQAFKSAVLAALPALSAGTIVATGNLPEPMDKDAVADGLLHIAPPCTFCSFSGLCGTAWEHAHEA